MQSSIYGHGFVNEDDSDFDDDFDQFVEEEDEGGEEDRADAGVAASPAAGSMEMLAMSRGHSHPGGGVGLPGPPRQSAIRARSAGSKSPSASRSAVRSTISTVTRSAV